MKTFFLIAIMVFSFMYGNTQTNDNSGIVFDTTVYNFGVIEKGSDAEYVFTFTNKGKDVVVVTNVKASCSCTVPTWTKEPVLQGKTGVIKVKYNTNTIGVFNKETKVFVNGSEQAIILTIKGEVKKK